MKIQTVEQFLGDDLHQPSLNYPVYHFAEYTITAETSDRDLASIAAVLITEAAAENVFPTSLRVSLFFARRHCRRLVRERTLCRLLAGMRFAALIALILLVVLAVSGCSLGPQLTRLEKQKEIAWAALHAVDTLQTIEIAQKPEQYQELNPVLGSHPSESAVIAYMGAWFAIHPLITRLLPSRYRPIWQNSSIAVTGAVVGHNLSIGLGVSF